MNDDPSKHKSEPSCGGDADSCCDSGDRTPLDRRRFLQLAGAGAALAATAEGQNAIAGPFDKSDAADHFVPVDKKLKPEWVKALSARGQRTWYQGDDLKTIGMPIGGICAGQVYLASDGRLVYWDIFNQNHNTGYGQVNYKVGRAAEETVGRGKVYAMPLVDQGFALRVKTGDGTATRTLDRRGFPGVRFCGEYPIGYVEYADEACPVRVSLEAFSPFIPLNAADSALPATIMNFTVENTSDAKTEVTLAGWLQNVVLRHNGGNFGDQVQRVSRAIRNDDCTVLSLSIKPRQPAEKPGDERPPVVFADFEGKDYGDWRIEGDAFGAGPAQGTLEKQQPVSGYKGKGLVNTYLGANDLKTGKLVSPEFTIERPWIGFLIGGGDFPGKTCMNLVIGGKTVRTAIGRHMERLRPHNWNVKDLIGKKAHLEIVDQEKGPWGHINIDQIEFGDRPMGADVSDLKRLPDYGTMGLAVLGGGETFHRASLPDGAAADALFADRTPEADATAAKPLDQALRGAVGRTVTLEAGEKQTITFIVSWCMPNMHRGKTWVGNYYAKRFGSAADAAQYMAANFDRLAGQTRLWHETYYDSTLPHWFLDRVGATVCNLATTTCQWWRNGRFWAWEGGGCCHGTCGHVWNYEHAMARLFPELERSVREMQDLAPGVGLVPETGEIRFRGEGWGIWAGDSQGGYVLKACREHQCSADDKFLNRNWRNIRRATEFLIDQDGNADGLIEGKQHQTYDQDYYGANTMVGSLYLGALRAAEQLAREVGDETFADTCRKVFESGRKLSVEKLFNGEYYIQDVDLKKHPHWQYGDGCLADQMFGQGWAHQVALGYLYPKETVTKTLQSIWKYCFTPDVGPQNKTHKPERWFAYPGEAGLFTCTWPKSKHLGPKSTRYRNEIWTGIEYQVAGHMAWEGMITEALAICRAIHERYHPSKHNPFNEIECGDHYARALASWGVLTGLAGFEYHGPAGRFGFAPRFGPESFRSVFTAAEGWGTISRQRNGGKQTNRVELKWGRLRINTLVFDLPDADMIIRVTVTIDGKPVPAKHTIADGRVTVQLENELVIQAGQTLEATVL